MEDLSRSAGRSKTMFQHGVDLPSAPRTGGLEQRQLVVLPYELHQRVIAGPSRGKVGSGDVLGSNVLGARGLDAGARVIEAEGDIWDVVLRAIDPNVSKGYEIVNLEPSGIDAVVGKRDSGEGHRDGIVWQSHDRGDGCQNGGGDGVEVHGDVEDFGKGTIVISYQLQKTCGYCQTKRQISMDGILHD